MDDHEIPGTDAQARTITNKFGSSQNGFNKSKQNFNKNNQNPNETANSGGNHYQKSNANHNKLYKNHTKADTTKSLTERSMRIKMGVQKLNKEIIFTMKETEFEIDLDRIKREKCDVEMAYKLKQQMQRKKDDEKVKKNKKLDAGLAQIDDQSDRASVLTDKKSKYSKYKTLGKKSKLNEGNLCY